MQEMIDVSRFDGCFIHVDEQLGDTVSYQRSQLGDEPLAARRY